MNRPLHDGATARAAHRPDGGTVMETGAMRRALGRDRMPRRA